MDMNVAQPDCQDVLKKVNNSAKNTKNALLALK
jgi:hypothetical protein